MKIFGYTITIKRAPKRRTGYKRRQWSESETNTALRLRSEGKTITQIASMLNRTEASVNSRFNKIRNKK